MSHTSGDVVITSGNLQLEVYVQVSLAFACHRAVDALVLQSRFIIQGNL